jgi:hypothetical protein
MMFKGLLTGLLGGASSLFSGALPYVMAGSLIVGTAGGFYLGSVWYGNKYKGELDAAHQETSVVQQRYDGFKIGALANAARQNDDLFNLQNRVRSLSDQITDEHLAYLDLENKKSNDLKKGLRDAKDSQSLSDSAIAYFKQLRGSQGN